jgi:hypothetical protein
VGEGCRKKAGEEVGERGGEPAGEEDADDTGVVGDEAPCIIPTMSVVGAEAVGAAVSEDLTAIGGSVPGVCCSSTAAPLGTGRDGEGTACVTIRPSCVSPSEAGCLGEEDTTTPCCTDGAAAPTV